MNVLTVGSLASLWGDSYLRETGSRIPAPGFMEGGQSRDEGLCFLSLPVFHLFCSPPSLDIPVWLLLSEQSELIFSHQLSPGPSGCAALGCGNWGPRDCGVIVCVHVCVYAYVCVCECECEHSPHHSGDQEMRLHKGGVSSRKRGGR